MKSFAEGTLEIKTGHYKNCFRFDTAELLSLQCEPVKDSMRSGLNNINYFNYESGIS